MKKWLLFFIPILLCAESISEKKATLVQKNTSLGSDISFLNDRLSTLKKSLEEAYGKANALAKQEAEEKRINDEKLAKEREEARIAKEREKELARQSKEQDKIAKRAVSDAAKKQKVELRAAKKLEAAASVPSLNSKKF